MPRKQAFPRLVGSKWTAQTTTWGWRHFHVINRKNYDRLVFAELVASCDPTTRFWLNASVLKNRHLWKPGWQPLTTLTNQENSSATLEERNTQ